MKLEQILEFRRMNLYAIARPRVAANEDFFEVANECTFKKDIDEEGASVDDPQHGEAHE